MKKIISIVILSMIISGCSSFGKKPADVVVSVDRVNVCGNPPLPDQIVMREVMPIVVKDENGLFWIGIAPKHYENLSINIQGMLQYIKQQKAIIQYFQKCKK
jgi:hypothetical protein